MDAAAEEEVQRGEGLVDAREHRARREAALLQRVEQRLELRDREQAAQALAQHRHRAQHVPVERARRERRQRGTVHA